jgi:hypothetical protein
VDDPAHLAKHLGIPPMSEEATTQAYAESDARLVRLVPIAPLVHLLLQIVVGTYIATERLTGIAADDDTSLEEIQDRYLVVADAAVRVVLSVLADTQSIQVEGHDDDEQ